MRIHRSCKTMCLLALTSCLALAGTASGAEPRTVAATGKLGIEQLFQLGSVGDPQVSPDGEWIAYTVSRSDLEADKTRSRIWVVPFAGGEAVAMTAEDESSSHPRWSPDGRYLAFRSARNDKPGQVFRLSRQGGEAVQVTDTAQSVNSFEWSPDSASLVLVLQDAKPEELKAKEQGEDYEEKTPPPFVIDRLQFKQDYVGYLDRRRTHLYLLN
ncbi:MAG: TolB family protein, partial [Lysobacterales bacterium]